MGVVLWRIAIVTCLVGCDSVLGLGHFDPPPDAPGVDTFMPEVGCSPMRMLADDFSIPNNLWPHRVVTNGNTLTQGSGQIEIGMNANGFGVFGADRYFDLRNDSFSIQVAVTGAMAIDDYVQIDLTSEVPGYSLTMSLENGELVMRRIENSQALEANRIMYSPITDAYWRIANTGTHTTWETSNDGVTYVVRATVDNLTYVTFMNPVVTAARSGASTFNVVLDNADQGLPPAHACKVIQLHDDFSGTMLGQQWARSQSFNGTLVEQGGTLDVAFATDGSNTMAAIVPSTIYDLRDGAFTIEIPKMVDVAATQLHVFVLLAAVDGSNARFEQSGGMLYVVKNGTTPVDARTYDPGAHRWWRIREAGGVIYWDVSSDGMAFTQLGMASDLVGFDRVDIFIEAVGIAVKATTTSFDNVDP